MAYIFRRPRPTRPRHKYLGSVILTLVASGTTYSLTGNAATFSINEQTLGTTYSLTGNAATFSISEGALSASYIVSGFPAVFSQLWSLSGSASFVFTGYTAELCRDFVNWLPNAGPSGTWKNDPAPSSAWSPLGSPSGTWSRASGLSSSWTAKGQPSSTWIQDNAMFIPPKQCN